MITLGVDISTQSFSGVVYDSQKQSTLCEHSVNFGERLPQFNAPNGFVETENNEFLSDPLMWLEACDLFLSELKEKFDLSQIEAISGAAQQHASVYLNAQWFDGREFVR